MTLIKSISGIRGTIGGPAGENLTPPDVVKFTTAYVRLIARRNPGNVNLQSAFSSRLLKYHHRHTSPQSQPRILKYLSMIESIRRCTSSSPHCKI